MFERAKSDISLSHSNLSLKTKSKDAAETGGNSQTS
jgi:hypothetical protein